MNANTVKLVQESWSKIAPIAPQAAELFYKHLFAMDPELKPLFRGDKAAQGARLMQMLGAAVDKLDDFDALIPILQDLGRSHESYGVRDAHYRTAGAALLAMLERGLGPDFTPPVKEAWAIAYCAIAKVMKNAAAMPA